MFVCVTKAQQVNGEPQAQTGERNGTGSCCWQEVPNGRLPKKPRRHRKDGHSTGSKSVAEGRHKGKRSWKNHTREKYWKLFIRYRQRPCMEVPRPKSFAFMASCRDQTDKKWPSKNEWCYRDFTRNPSIANGGGRAGPSLLLPPALSLIDQNQHTLWRTPGWKVHAILNPNFFPGIYPKCETLKKFL